MNPNPEFPTAVSIRDAEAISGFEEIDCEVPSSLGVMTPANSSFQR